MKKTFSEKCDFGKYGQDALEAWNHYNADGNPGGLLPVIGDRIRKMGPELVKTLYICALVFADTSRNSR